MTTHGRLAHHRGRPTIYNGIHMRSRLEARAAQILDSLGIQWQYEPQCFANPTGQYLPDFVIPGTGFDLHRFYATECAADVNRYVEVKPTSQFDDENVIRRVQEQMAVILSSDPTGALMIWSPELGEAHVSDPWGEWAWFHQGPGPFDRPFDPSANAR